MFLNNPAYRIQLRPAKSACLLKGDGVQPEFCHHVLSSHMDMGSFTAVKKKR
jgi:hypothetical protein